MTRSVVINGSKRSSAIVCTFLIISSAEFSGYCLFDIRRCKNLKMKHRISKYIIFQHCRKYNQYHEIYFICNLRQNISKNVRTQSQLLSEKEIQYIKFSMILKFFDCNSKCIAFTIKTFSNNSYLSKRCVFTCKEHVGSSKFRDWLS